MSGLMIFIFPSHHYARWSPALLEVAEHPPAHGKQLPSSEWILVLLCLCAASAFPIELCLSQPARFPAFSFPVLSPVPREREWTSGCLGLNHDRGNLEHTPLLVVVLVTVDKDPAHKSLFRHLSPSSCSPRVTLTTRMDKNLLLS